MILRRWLRSESAPAPAAPAADSGTLQQASGVRKDGFSKGGFINLCVMII